MSSLEERRAVTQRKFVQRQVEVNTPDKSKALDAASRFSGWTAVIHASGCVGPLPAMH
jgi:hypothetical protein